jgi:hypothetical protein
MSCGWSVSACSAGPVGGLVLAMLGQLEAARRRQGKETKYSLVTAASALRAAKDCSVLLSRACTPKRLGQVFGVYCPWPNGQRGLLPQ